MLQLICPFLCEIDILLLLGLLVDRISLALRMSYQLFYPFWVKCICDVEHVLSIALSSFGIFIWKIVFKAWKFNELRIQVLNGELIKLWDLDELDLVQLHQMLFSLEDFFNEILGAHLVWHHIILKNKYPKWGKYLLGDDSEDNRRCHFYLRIGS